MMVRRGGGPNRLLSDKDDSRGKLEALAQEIRKSGGAATAMFADGTDPKQVEAPSAPSFIRVLHTEWRWHSQLATLIVTIEQDIGPIHFVNCVL